MTSAKMRKRGIEMSGNEKERVRHIERTSFGISKNEKERVEMQKEEDTQRDKERERERVSQSEK